VINTLQEGRLYLKAGRIERGSSHMKEVVVYDLSDPTRRRTILADSGEIGFAPNRRDLYMTLYSGVMQEVPTQEIGQLTRLFFGQDRIRVVGVGSQFEESRTEQGKSDREMTICEMTSSVVAAERRRDLAEHDLKRVRAEADRLKGVDRPDPAPWKFQRPTTLGGLYCSLLTRLGAAGVKEARASQVQDGAPPARRPPPRSVEGGGDARLRAAMTRAANAGGRPVLVATPVGDSAGRRPANRRAGVTPGVDSMEAHRARERIEDARQQVDMHAKTRDRYLVEIHKKFSLAATCVVFVLLGAPIALRFPRGGVGLVIGVSLGIFALYYVGLIGGEALADRSIISPVWAMWGANIIMAVVGLFMTARMGRETATARGGDFGDLLESARVWVAKAGRRVGIPLDRRRRLA
jgi:lipopolysaccharide export system permease protein